MRIPLPPLVALFVFFSAPGSTTTTFFSIQASLGSSIITGSLFFEQHSANPGPPAVTIVGMTTMPFALTESAK